MGTGSSVQPIGVIVLGYNRFDGTTGRCIASLAQDPDFRTWNVLMVDNGSDAENRDAAKQAAAHYRGLRLIRIERNAGFPGGMNAGLRQVEGDLIFMISSDVLVPPGTVGRLAAVFERYPGAGLVCPVTNNAGNEQRIFTEAGDVGSVLAQGRAFAEATSGGILSAYRLDLCCAGLRRTAMDRVGLFDEAFNPGYYEDFDYSLRIRKAGFELLVVETAFVYHEGGGTFGRVSSEKKALVARNKNLFLRKHGRETLLPHARDCNLAALAQYAGQVQHGEPVSAYRVSNRLKLAEADMPRSPFKRWRYKRRVTSVRARLMPLVAKTR
jgi:GT2 family glycosyltransferase